MAKVKNTTPIPSEELVQNLNQLSSEFSPTREDPQAKVIEPSNHDPYKPKH